MTMLCTQLLRGRLDALLVVLLVAMFTARMPLASDPAPQDEKEAAKDGEPADLNADDKKVPAKLPPGAKIRLVPLKDRWLLGENILLYYEVKNEGDKPFTVDVGGDYRGGTRAGRFKVTAVSERGILQDDPAPVQIEMGGLGGTYEIKPGESWYGNVPLMRYRTLAGPGRYSIRVAHDMGWGGPVVDGMLDPRWAEVDIRVEMPGDMQAREVVAQMQRMTNSGASWGQKREMYPDYSCLRYPVYLPVLRELARAQHPEAVQGITGIETPAGTKALIELLSLPDDAETRRDVIADLKRRDITVWENDTVSDLAARALYERVPYPEALRSAPNNAWRGEDFFELRDKRARACWRPEHAAPVRKYAKDVLLNSKSTNLRDSRKEYAVGLMQAIGVEEDHAAIVAALDKALELSARVPLESPLIYGVIPDLQRCAKILEIPAAAEPKTPGQIAIYLQSIKPTEAASAEDFSQRGPAWLRHSIPYVRRLTLEALPRPVPGWAIDDVASLLKSKDAGVRLQAAEATAGSKWSAGSDTARRLGEAVMAQIAVEEDPWVISALDRAAYAAGIPRDQVLEAWAKRLDETMYDAATQQWGTAAKSFEILQSSVIEYTGGSGWDGTQRDKVETGLSQRWLAFIAANREDLRRGRKFRVGDAELKADLFPIGAHIYHEGKPWPVFDPSPE